MAEQKSKFDEFLSDKHGRRVYERESLAFEASEMICRLMEESGVNRAELAHRIGASKSLVTQLLTGSRNMTMHTLADLAFSLDHKIEMHAQRIDAFATGSPCGGEEHRTPFSVGSRRMFVAYRHAEPTEPGDRSGLRFEDSLGGNVPAAA